MPKPMMLDLWQHVLLSISRLCDRRSFTGPTVEDVIADIEQRYGRKYSRRTIEEAVSYLESRGLVYRRRGLLRDGRTTLLTTKEPERVALTLIRLNPKEALVHDGWEGKVYDPPYNMEIAEQNQQISAAISMVGPIGAGLILLALSVFCGKSEKSECMAT